jgi:hypothetical protein
VEEVTTVSFNKLVAAGHFLALGCGVPPFLLAGRGGEEQDRCDAFCPGSLVPLASRGGEEWRRRFSVVLASRSVPDPQMLGGGSCGAGEDIGLDFPSSSLPSRCQRGGDWSSMAYVSSSCSGDRRRVGLSLPFASCNLKLRARRSYQQLSELLYARLRSSSFFLEAKTPKRKIFSSC